MAINLTPELKAKLLNELQSLEMQLSKLEEKKKQEEAAKASAPAPLSKEDEALEQIRIHDPGEYVRIMENRTWRTQVRAAANDVSPADLDAVARLFENLKPADVQGWTAARRQAIAINPSFANTIPEAYDASVQATLKAGKKASTGDIKKGLSSAEFAKAAGAALYPVKRGDLAGYESAMRVLQATVGSDTDVYQRTGLPQSGAALTDADWNEVEDFGQTAVKKQTSQMNQRQFLTGLQRSLATFTDADLGTKTPTPAELASKKKAYTSWYEGMKKTYNMDDATMAMNGFAPTFDQVAVNIAAAGGDLPYEQKLQTLENSRLTEDVKKLGMNSKLAGILKQAGEQARMARNSQISPTQVNLLSSLPIHIEEGNSEVNNAQDIDSKAKKGMASPARIATVDALARIERGGQATQFSTEAMSPQMGAIAHFLSFTYVDDATWEAVKRVCHGTIKWANNHIDIANGKVDSVGGAMVQTAADGMQNVDQKKALGVGWQSIAKGLKYSKTAMPRSLGTSEDEQPVDERPR